MKKLSQNGFTAVEGLLILVIVGIIGGVGWFVWNNRSAGVKPAADKSSQSIKAVSAKDTTKTFSYSYPSSWKLQKFVWQDCCEGPPKSEPDWNKTSQTITLQNKSNDKAEIIINGFTNFPDSVDREIESEIESIDKDQFNTYSKVTINGYKGIKHVLDFVGPSDAEKYKDTTYIIFHGNDKVNLYFRERYSNATLNGENDFDATNLYSDFETIVNSIKFNS